LTLLAAPSAVAADTQWAPDAKVIAQIEAGLNPPANPLARWANPIDQYARYYSGLFYPSGRKWVKALLVKPKHEGDKLPGIYVVDVSQLPYTHEGTCDVIHIMYDLDVPSGVGVSQFVLTACGGGPP